MGKKLDAILGRSFKSYKLKALANLAVSRLAVFKNQRQARRNQARSDVVQLLQQGHHDTALLRVDYVIKEQNLLDVYLMMEGYFNLLVERIHLIEQESRVCPDELKEAISSLLFASSRCGDFPELQEIRAVLTTRYGRELAARSIELRNNCGVIPKMIQKLSTRQSELENRTNVLKEIASENGLALQLEEGSEKQIKPEQEMAASSSGTNKAVGSLILSLEEMKKFELSDSMKVRRQFRDVADAAQAAFESAAYAAEAARAAVELSRSDSSDPGNQYSPHNRVKQASPFGNQDIVHEHEGEESKSATEGDLKIFQEHEGEELKGRSLSTSSSVSERTEPEVITVSVSSEEEEDLAKKLDKNIVFDDSDDESPKSDLTINSSVVQSGLKHRYSTAYDAEASRIQSSPRLNIAQGRPLSVRTRRVHGS